MKAQNHLVLVVLLCTLLFPSDSKAIYYLYSNEVPIDQKVSQELKQNTHGRLYEEINCSKANCQKFKPDSFPCLVLWRGPGTSFKKIQPANLQGLEQTLNGLNTHPLKFIRDFMDQISLIQSFGVAFVFATLFFLMFSVIFKDRSGLEASKSKKNL